MRSWGLSVLPALFAVGALTFACSDMSASSFDAESGPTNGGTNNPDLNGDKAGAAPSNELVPTDNGVILVHAAGMPAFRVCFENEPDRLPSPDREVMPDANVVGVEVGSAVRIAPLLGAPGRIFVFAEPLIRDFIGKGATCRSLLSDPSLFALAHEMAPVDSDYSKGVHLLVVRGCQGKTAFVSYTKEQCGTDYEETKPHGNLSIFDKELKGGNRNGDDLPSQVIHLSQAIEGSRGAAELAVTFGDVKQPGSVHTSVAAAPALFGDPLALFASPSFKTTEEPVYAELGFRVTLKDGANTPTVLAQQTLADVQTMSAPREIPTEYYSAASNYVLLLLGAPTPKLGDGGPDSDPLKKVHLLAIPVIEPKADGGAEDGGGANDAGAAPDGAQ